MIFIFQNSLDKFLNLTWVYFHRKVLIFVEDYTPCSIIYSLIISWIKFHELIIFLQDYAIMKE